MALCGVCWTPNLLQSAKNSKTGIKRNRRLWQLTSTKSVTFRCSSSLKTPSSNVEIDEEEEDVQSNNPSVSMEDESAHVKQFKWNDFKILDRVSIGHGGRVFAKFGCRFSLHFYYVGFGFTKFTFLAGR